MHPTETRGIAVVVPSENTDAIEFQSLNFPVVTHSRPPVDHGTYRGGVETDADKLGDDRPPGIFETTKITIKPTKVSPVDVRIEAEADPVLEVFRLTVQSIVILA